jgi:hypothetical protein
MSRVKNLVVPAIFAQTKNGKPYMNSETSETRKGLQWLERTKTRERTKKGWMMDG